MAIGRYTNLVGCRHTARKLLQRAYRLAPPKSRHAVLLEFSKLEYFALHLPVSIGLLNFGVLSFPSEWKLLLERIQQLVLSGRYLDALRRAGFDLMLTANNHILDRRDKGLRRTVKTIESRGLPWVGAYADAAQRDSIMPRIVDIGGYRVAFLNYTYGTNGIEIQGDVVVDYIDRDQMAADVAEAREKGAEIIVAAVHWGEEYQLLSNRWQRSLADYLTDLGVDLIIGGHPHVIQPMEIRHSEKHDKDVFLCYSLGNFVSAMRTDDTRGGALARVVIDRDEKGKAVVKSAGYRLVYVLPPDGQSTSYRVIPEEDTMIPASMADKRRRFETNARRIFDRHNVSVPLDTLTMRDYLSRMILKQMP